VRELRDLLSQLPFEVVVPSERLLEPLPEEAELEGGTSFAENAVAKARYFAMRGNLPTLAEDSGLEVDALGGAPGVISARWAQREGRPTARYRAVVAYLEAPHARPQLVEATCEGRILPAPRGTGGFGYDPLFFSPELGMSFAEAPLAAKQRVSHRGRAVRALVEVLLRRAG